MRSPSAADSRSPVSQEPFGQPVDPEATVGVEHHLDDRRDRSRKPAMAGPRAVRSMRAPRRIASDFWCEMSPRRPRSVRDRDQAAPLDRG